MKAVTLQVTGKVQGVYFRASTVKVAKSLKLSGWVKNEADGSVSIFAQGSPEALEQLIQWAWRGPEGAVVNDVSVSDVEPRDVVNFTILRN